MSVSNVLCALSLPVLLAACVGPPAPDAAVCQDLIHRLCAAPVCSAVSALGVPDCEAAALARTGCGDDSFAFATPTRDRLLECRAMLLHPGQGPNAHPDCGDVDAMAQSCPDVVQFLEGAAP